MSSSLTWPGRPADALLRCVSPETRCLAIRAAESIASTAGDPRGRVLPGLVPDEPLRRPLRDAAPTPAKSGHPSRAPKRAAVRTSKGKDQGSRLLRNGASAPTERRAGGGELSTESRRTASAQSDGGAGVANPDRDDRVKSSCQYVRRSGAEGKGLSRRTSEPSLCPTTNAPRRGRTLRPRFLRGSTVGHLNVDGRCCGETKRQKPKSKSQSLHISSLL